MLDLYAVADILETEMFHTDRSQFISKFAPAQHVWAANWFLLEPAPGCVNISPGDILRPEISADDMFLSGVNYIF